MPQTFDNLPGLDFEKGLDVFEGEMDDYISALQSYTRNAPDIINKLRDVKKESLPDYAVNVHGLKSISAWICAERIREGALELETLAKSGDFSEVNARNDKFLNDAETFIKELASLLETNEG